MAAKFGPDSPLWDTFIDLRRNGVKIKELLKLAKEHDPPYDLTWYQLYYGMRKAPAVFGLPTKSALWLKYKYKAIEGKISAYNTLVELLGEALERLQKMHIDMAVADTTERRFVLEHKFIPEAMDRAHDYALDIAKLDAEIRRAVGISELPQSNPALNVGTQNVVVLAGKDLSEFSRLLSQEFVAQIGAGSAEDAAMDQFGHDNVRAVTDADEDVDNDGDYAE